MELSERTQLALEALRRTVDLARADSIMLQSYVSDVVCDAESIVRREGAPFLWGVGPNCTVMVPMDVNADTMIYGVEHSYGDKVKWYVWEGEVQLNKWGCNTMPYVGDHEAAYRYTCEWRRAHDIATLEAACA